MKAKLKREMFINVGWFSGLPLALVAVFGFSFARLNAQKSHIAGLQREIEVKQKRLEQWPDHASDQVDAEQNLAEWQRILASESQRVAELSDAARSADVRLVAIKCLETESTEDGLVALVTHELRALGGYRELSTFFAHIYKSRGTVGIEDLEIDSAEDPTANELEASLKVTWYAKGPGKVTEKAAEEEG